MKCVFLNIFLTLIIQISYAQILNSGNYSSFDGRYTVIVKHEGNAITITEPNKLNVYKSSGGDKYYHANTQYSAYYIRVVDINTFFSGKIGEQDESLFKFLGSSALENGSLPSGIDDCPLYDKYLNLSQTDEVDAHTWVFCGAAALAKCTYNSQGVEEYLEPIIQTMKSMMDNTSKCPCEEVISQYEWNAVTNY